MIQMDMIVDVTRTIDVAATIGPDRATSEQLIDTIIADFRSSMGAMKCAMSERLVRLGISMAQLNIMYILHRDGEMTMSHLADALNVSLSNASGLADRMEERGFIERTRVPEDRRVVRVRITPAGTRVIEEHDAGTDALLHDVLDRLDPDQLSVIAGAVAKFRAGLQASTATAEADRHLVSMAAPRSR
jgi:DNA-binding MarR family transcriptional regulator